MPIRSHAAAAKVLGFPAPARATAEFAARWQPSAVKAAGPVAVLRAQQPQATLPAMQSQDALLHDARNVLTSMTLLSGLLGDEQHAYAGDLQSITQQLAGLLGGLAGADLRKEPPARARTATQAVKNCEGLLKTMAGNAVAVHISAESHLPALKLDDEELARVLGNLVKNAGEAMPSGGTVHITARRALSRDRKAVLLHVADNGPGIPAHALSNIFEPWFSSKPHSGRFQVGEACGLGLAIVRQLVEECGGEVRVASTRRRGTTFELRIPCFQEAD